MHMFYGDGYYMAGMHGLWWLFWLVIVGVLLFYGWGRRGKDRRLALETPLEVLKRRLATGEITPEQYDERKAVIERDSGSSA